MTANERYYRARADLCRALLTAPYGAERRYRAATVAADLCLPPRDALRRQTAPGLSAGLLNRALAREERRALAQAVLADVSRETRRGAGAEARRIASPTIGLGHALRADDPHDRAVYAVASLYRDAKGGLR